MKYLVLALAVLVTTKVSAQGLMINAAEVGVGKFHRYDAKQHPKEYANNVWSDYVMPDAPTGSTPFVYETAPNKITIQFQTLEELLTAIVKVSAQKGQKVAVLNLNGHGMPGGMWFPKDEADKKSKGCDSWNKSALAPDIDNYNQYYSPVSLGEIIGIRMAARLTGKSYACTTGAAAWTEVASRVVGLKDAFAENAQVHFESCTVGLGKAGEEFAATVASLLLKGDKAAVQTLIPLGLGDWSMPEGMGFWDFQNITQLNADNKRYPVNKNDREEMQKGTVRVTQFVNGVWTSQLISNLDFMLVGFEPPPAATINNVGPTEFDVSDFGLAAVAPQSVRIPGTGVSVELIQ